MTDTNASGVLDVVETPVLPVADEVTPDITDDGTATAHLEEKTFADFGVRAEIVRRSPTPASPTPSPSRR